MSMECEDVRISLGVYVLGAIDPAERSVVDAHLNTCPSCRDELAGLAGLPALLGRVGETQITALAEPPGPPDDLLEPLLAQAAAGRLRRLRRLRRDDRWRGHWSGRWTPLVAATAVLLVVAALFGGVLGGLSEDPRPPLARPSGTSWTHPGPSPSQKTEELRASDTRTGVSARLVVTGRRSGTQAELHLKGVPLGSHCRLEAVDHYGRRDSMGSWEVAYRGYSTFTGSTMFQRDRVTSFRIVTDDGRTLLVIPA